MVTPRKHLRTNNSNVCYLCGELVAPSEGGREHIIPKTILQDSTGEISDFIIAKENSHAKCNKEIGDKYEHDFCQIISHYSIDEPKAKKHIESKISNLKQKPEYLRNQFSKMRKVGDKTEINFAGKELISFKKVVKKIIKGLYFKNTNQFLDIKNDYRVEIIWSTLNLEHLEVEKQKVISFLSQIGDVVPVGNNIFKYRFKKAVDGKSYVWELVFYDRFPIYCLLIHKDDLSSFTSGTK
ncbi:MAG: hypothetical protein UT66_C0040G0004 [candidate division CPR2 bacterium GW2011_GWC1_39_9]|nr:MAG: hypothetical protein UT66_C0040G0004 [candidate division CPR2 bacterium GW2011_GWC1_39_9]HCH59044.1 hypothetical protein [Candidatus Zambryskibacteria bacterium]